MDLRAPEELAKAINTTFHLGFTARPWNLHAPGDTLWWLVPSTEFPAHRHAKYVCSFAKDDHRRHLLASGETLTDERIFAGFLVEKGYGPEAVAVDHRLAKRPTAMLDGTWAWSRVVQPPGPTRLRDVLSTAAHPLVVAAVAYPVHDPDDRERMTPDVLTFSCVRGALSLQARNRLPLDALSNAVGAQSLDGLLDDLGKVSGYYWVDFQIGTYVIPGEVDLQALYDEVLAHFAHWVE
jgi:hypothetical protein